MTSEYAYPEVLVDTDWVASHHSDPDIRIVEVDVDTTQYEQGHIPDAIGFNWQSQLNHPIRRDIISRADIESLLSQHGIDSDDTIVLYGDNNNRFAAFAFWILKVYGHDDVRLMNGGRQKWLAENRETTSDAPSHATTHYRATEPNITLRAMRDDVFQALKDPRSALIDVRSPQEYRAS